jgi:hypothetical protein
MTKFLGFVAAVLLVVATGAGASAETIAATATRIANDNGTNTHFFKELTDAGATAVFFVTTVRNSQVKVTYNAECAVKGPSQAWISVTILVDGVQANPKNGTDFGFCTALSTTAWQWVGAVRQSFITVPATGTHHVQVLVDLLNGATNWWLGDTSLAVETQ